MELYGRNWTRRELAARVGRIEQVGGIRRFQLTEGPEKGVDQIQVRTGAGLTYYVSPDRGLDISLAEFCGAPISWQSPNGDVAPEFFDPSGLEWLRTAAGGLLMTCGFTQAGAPSEDAGEALGLHGRAHHTPAYQVSATAEWRNDGYVMQIRGIVEETKIFGEKIRLTREIQSKLGANRITITDRYENLGFTDVPLMLLYHFNFGFPLLSEDSVFHFPSNHVEPREAETPIDGYTNWQLPEPGHTERVYLHSDLQSDSQGYATATVETPNFPVGPVTLPVTMRLSWMTDTLPGLVQWRMAGAGEHVLGIEPTNANVLGRAAARADGSLIMLAPGEHKSCQLHVSLETGT